MPPAATTAMQSEMFAFGREYLDKRNYRRLSSAHWSANNRERSWYNILAKADVPIFPFGSGSGGNVGGGWNIQWFVIPIHIFTSAGEFWYVNLAQSTLEAIEYIMTESSSFAMESVAAQDTKQGHPQGHGTGNNHSHVTNIDGESQPTHPHNGKADRLQGMFKGIEIEHKTRGGKPVKSVTMDTVGADNNKTTNGSEGDVPVNEAERKAKLIEEAKAKIAESGANPMAVKMMIAAMKNLSADDIEYMMEKMSNR